MLVCTSYVVHWCWFGPRFGHYFCGPMLVCTSHFVHWMMVCTSALVHGWCLDQYGGALVLAWKSPLVHAYTNIDNCCRPALWSIAAVRRNAAWKYLWTSTDWKYCYSVRWIDIESTLGQYWVDRYWIYNYTAGQYWVDRHRIWEYHGPLFG